MGYVFRRKTWQGRCANAVRTKEFLDIKYAKPFSPIDNAIKNLVMNERNRKMVEVLTHKYKEGQRGVGGAWTADYIQSKGEGQIFLLHGPPGVGKTYTAECIAEHTRKTLWHSRSYIPTNT